MSIITEYKISFGVKKIDDRDFKFIRSINYSLDSVITDFRNILNCDNLLGAINSIMESPSPGEILYTTQGLQLIKITHSTTEIYRDSVKHDSDPGITADYTLPTEDFKEIVIVWRNFVVNGEGEKGRTSFSRD
ncbi:hypothetical protein ACQ7CX_11390 [Chryseobacterium arthrosphaerae]|uniref:hypothetical protein n=1 Tax=Chryseobacterium arthrosphaerae TaxID=651561 RepID=UPI001BAF81FC|nr:hypothetical protein [Chryseobacterium arthrosphaerae]QUY54040.1 hypothetical protein I2F65_14230 [Chryseobacterium arthrosphaerae]